MIGLSPAFRRAWQGAIALLVLIIVSGSLVNGQATVDISGLDKLGHGGAYFALTLLGIGIAERGLWRVAAASFLLGLCLEGAQAAWTADREADWLDLVANAAGILAAWLPLAPHGAGWARHVEAWWRRRHER